MGFTSFTGGVVRDEIVTGSPTPTTRAAGTWNANLMNTYKSVFTIIPRTASGAAWSGFFPIYAQSVGGIWLVSNTLSMFNSPGDVQTFGQGLTWPAFANIEIELDVPGATIAISGATTGNGRYALGSPGPWWSTGIDAGVLSIGQFSGGSIFDGVIQSIYNWGQARP